MVDRVETGVAIRNLRNSFGISASALAIAVNVGPMSISRLEQGALRESAFVLLAESVCRALYAMHYASLPPKWFRLEDCRVLQNE